MHAMNKSCGLAAALYWVSLHAMAADPFGITMGTPVTSLPDCRAEARRAGEYLCRSLPRADAAFDGYQLIAHPSTGVCRISAAGKDIRDSGAGTRTRRQADRLVSQLTAEYGPPTTRVDAVVDGGPRDERAWLAGIASKQRHYDFFWTADDGYAPKGNVVAIHVSTHASGTTTGWLMLSFEFANFEDCAGLLGLDADGRSSHSGG